MTQADLFDLPEGKRQRSAGETRVLSNSEIWREGYTNTVRGWFDSLPVGTFFIGEDLRRYCLKVGMTKPHHHNAWGAAAGTLIHRWLKACQIVQDGFGQSRAKKAHARRYPRYRKVCS